MTDRSSIDVALARRLVDAQFPRWSALAITEVAVDGWDNRTFRLGPELTVRLPSGEWYAKQVAKEQRWLPVLAPQLPLPIPTPVAAGAPGGGPSRASTRRSALRNPASAAAKWTGEAISACVAISPGSQR